MAAVQLAAELLSTPVGEGNKGEFALGDYTRKIQDMQQMVDDALLRNDVPLAPLQSESGTKD